MPPVSVRIRAVLVYIFVICLVYLAGIYVGRIFYFIYLMLVFVPILSALHLALSLFGLRYYQDFDTEHPTKGESIGYRLTVANEYFIATTPITVRFKSIHPELSHRLPEVTVTFTGSSSIRRNYTVQCPYRGIYTVGLESLQTRDILGWISVARPVFHRTFYVYPRIIDISPPFVGKRKQGITTLSETGIERDVSLFEGLRDYREGLAVRHIAWKRFVSTGTPYLKEFGRSAQPGLTIYLDLRRAAPLSPRILETEDCSIEISVALVKYYLESGIPVTVKAMSSELYVFHGSNPDSFDAFYRHTINLLFRPGLSPAGVFDSDHRDSSDSAALFVTHLLDVDILDILSRGGEGSTAAIVNLHSMSDGERARLETYSKTAAGSRLHLVHGPASIQEDLTA